MKRVHGGLNTAYVECINPRLMKYRVRWDFQPYYNENGKQEGVTYCEHEFKFKPTLDHIKEVVLAGYNEIINKEIINGFVWNGMKVWLSNENQFNYKSAYDLAIHTNGEYLPVMFKFGTDEEPIYYTFNDIETLNDFYTKAITHITAVLNEGWELKDNIDWSVYNIE